MKASMKSLMPCSRKYCYSSLKSVIHPEPPCVTCVQCNVCRNEGETRLSVREKVNQFSICSISVTEGYNNPAAMTHILRFLKAEVSESVYPAPSLSFWSIYHQTPRKNKNWPQYAISTVKISVPHLTAMAGKKHFNICLSN